MRKTTADDTRIGGIDMAGEIAKGMQAAGVGFPATLIRRTSRVPETGNIAGKTRVVETRIRCRGLRKEKMSGNARVVTVTLFAASILIGTDRIIPVEGDAVTIRGETFEIVEVEDPSPAAAIYRCKCKTVGSGPR
jgi:hypothetical protein